MKKIVTLIPLLSLTLMVSAQNFQTEVALVEVPNFNGKTLAKAPAGKGKTLQLVRTKYSRSMDSYTELALPSLKLGNIILPLEKITISMSRSMISTFLSK